MTDRDAQIQKALEDQTPLLDRDADVALYQQVFAVLATPTFVPLPDKAFAYRVMAAIARQQQMSIQLSLRERLAFLPGVLFALSATGVLLLGLLQLAPVLEFDLGVASIIDSLTPGLKVLQKGLPGLIGLAAGALVLGLDKSLHAVFGSANRFSD